VKGITAAAAVPRSAAAAGPRELGGGFLRVAVVGPQCFEGGGAEFGKIRSGGLSFSPVVKKVRPGTSPVEFRSMLAGPRAVALFRWSSSSDWRPRS